MTATANGPTSVYCPIELEPTIDHNALNQQTIHNSNRPKMSCSSVELAYSEEEKNLSVNLLDNHDKSTSKLKPSVPTDTNIGADNIIPISRSDESSSMQSIAFNNQSIYPNECNNSNVFCITEPQIIHNMSPLLTAEMNLLYLFSRHKVPLSLFKDTFNWAIQMQKQPGFNFATIPNPQPREKIFASLQNNHNLMYFHDFEQQLIPEWRPDNNPLEVTVCSFQNALKALFNKNYLFNESNISLPNSMSPYTYVNFPEVDKISELHHGSWWKETWQLKCKPNSNEMLVPIILYMDGISIDTHGKLTLTPLNMTLGIFNTSTRKTSEAWETIYFHPDSAYLSAMQTNEIESIDNVANLHNGLRIALMSFKEQCESHQNIVCQNFPWAGKKWNVEMKFSIAFVIGNTELHDKLCCWFGGRNAGVNVICRHCDCPTEHLCNPDQQGLHRKLWGPQDFSDDFLNNNMLWKELSHHPVKNVFHDLCFGANHHNIHLASPGECLHMHQLGSSKQAIESFRTFCGKYKKDGSRYKPKVVHDEIAKLSQKYGILLKKIRSKLSLHRLHFINSEIQKKRRKRFCWNDIMPHYCHGL